MNPNIEVHIFYANILYGGDQINYKEIFEDAYNQFDV